MPSQRTLLYLVLILTLGLGLWTGKSLFFTLVYLMLGTLVLSLVWAWAGLAGLGLERRAISHRGQVGRTLTEILTVQNRSVFPRLWLEVRDSSTLPNHQVSRVIFGMPPRGARTWQTHTSCLRRGQYRLGPITLVSGDPFGFFERRREIKMTAEILIYPATFPIHRFAPPSSQIAGGAAVRHRTHTITPNAAGIRDYVAGDSLRQIHWLSSARRGRLTVKEFEMDPMADFWIVLDNHQAAHVPAEGSHPLASTEEYGVSIAASLAEHLVQTDRTAGLVTYAPDRERISADRGARQLRKILELLAVTQATGQMALHDALRLEGERFARTTTILVITPSVDPTWLGAVRWLKYRRIRSVVVHIDPASFGGPDGTDGIIQGLSAAGVPVYPVQRGDNLSVALSGR